MERTIDDDELAEASSGGTLLKLDIDIEIDVSWEIDDVSVTSLVDSVFDPIVFEEVEEKVIIEMLGVVACDDEVARFDESAITVLDVKRIVTTEIKVDEPPMLLWEAEEALIVADEPNLDVVSDPVRLEVPDSPAVVLAKFCVLDLVFKLVRLDVILEVFSHVMESELSDVFVDNERELVLSDRVVIFVISEEVVKESLIV